jgi:hypothetical protein
LSDVKFDGGELGRVSVVGSGGATKEPGLNQGIDGVSQRRKGFGAGAGSDLGEGAGLGAGAGAGAGAGRGDGLATG